MDDDDKAFAQKKREEEKKLKVRLYIDICCKFIAVMSIFIAINN